MDPGHVGVGPHENILVVLERLLNALCLVGFQKGTSISETIISFRDLDGLQGICYREVFIRRVL